MTKKSNRTKKKVLKKVMKLKKVQKKCTKINTPKSNELKQKLKK